MTLADQLHQSAKACEGAAVALAHSLRPSTTHHDKSSPNVRQTHREAEAFAITCAAVMDEVAPILPFLQNNAPIVGRKLPVTNSRVKNGFDSLIVILLTLFDTSNNAILDVAGNRSRWLVSPLQASAAFERMAMHHGQLRAMYGIIHLAAKIISRANVSDTLFLDVKGTDAEKELEPARWRAAIKMDDFYGRCFGFHYSPEMRNVLRVVNIARGSVHRSHGDNDPTPEFIKNVAMLGWGWIYSNMVIMNNLGLSIEGVSRIGADSDRHMSIKELRKFMNLVEEPLVAGVSGLASPDVALDVSYDIPPPGTPGCPQFSDVDDATNVLRELFESVKEAVSVRVMSHKSRPIDLSEKRKKKKLVSPEDERGLSIVAKLDVNSDRKSDTKLLSEELNAQEAALNPAPGLYVQHNVLSPERVGTTDEHARQMRREEELRSQNRSNQTGLSTVAEKSYLATTIKSELMKLQSNMSSFLGLEEVKPARGLIIHFHGGGFVSQSTNSHQMYMKEWCVDIPDAVLFSIDYKLAPEHKFPRAVHECVWAYAWALQNATSLGTSAERIVFAGDSAGGNLAVATALLIAELGLRSPDGICVGYPALYVNVAWSASRLLSFFDPMLPLSVMELCVRSYLPDDDDEAHDNPFVSPVSASDEQLRKLPRIAIACGALDPLLDDSVLFAHRLREVGRERDMLRIYESLPHGFLNMSQVNDTARAGMKFLAKMISEYLELPLRRANRSENREDNNTDRTDLKAIASAVDE